MGEDFEIPGYVMAKYNPKILVVDDNEDNRYTLHRRLKKTDIQKFLWQMAARKLWTLFTRNPST